MANVSNDYLEQSKQTEGTKEVLHNFRKSIDALIQWANELRQDRESGFGREMSLTHTKLQEAKMWTGKCLEMIGSELPEEFQDKAK
ncbi:MAG TPA: hypothetical protein ENK96_03845 [Desulfobulbaceae bacterium]|nr:hypothetical protein [Desulfobulbaceae bacterium]